MRRAWVALLVIGRWRTEARPDVLRELLVDRGHVVEVAHARLEDDVAHAERGELADLTHEGVGVLTGGQPDARADRERVDGAAGLAARRCQVAEPGLHLLCAGKRRVPAVPQFGDAPERARRVAADPDRNRTAHGLRRHAERLEAEELAAVGHALIAPAGLHDADRLVAPGAPPRVRHTEELDLLLHPADTRAEHDAARR